MKYVKGSYTVEATVTVLVILIVVFGFFYFGMYLRECTAFHDLARMRLDRYERSLSEPVDLLGQLDIQRFSEWPVFMICPTVSFQEASSFVAELADDIGKQWVFLQPLPITMVDNSKGLEIKYQNKFKKGIPYIYRQLFHLSPVISDEKITISPEPEEFVRISRGVIWRKENGK